MNRTLRRPRLLSAMAAALLTSLTGLTACDAPLPSEPRDAPAPSSSAGEVTVQPHHAALMTRNLYLGADVAPLLDPTLPPSQIPLVGARVWQQVQDNDFAERARSLAAEIDRYRPEVVGLQEAALYRVETPADPTTAATQTALDFRSTLEAALASRGLDYEVVVESRNYDVELPVLDPSSPTFLTDVRLTDRDLVLVRGDVAWRNPSSDHFTVNLQVPVAGSVIEVTRGWSAAEVRIGDRWVRFLTTHLEPLSTGAFFQEQQAAEILDVVAASTLPTVAAGDFNADPSDPAGTYGILTGPGGMVDAWDPVQDGATCCQLPDLQNQTSVLDRRVDLVLLRGDLDPGDAGEVGDTRVERFGHRTGDRTPSGLWPSDHAGIVAFLQDDRTN